MKFSTRPVLDEKGPPKPRLKTLLEDELVLKYKRTPRSSKTKCDRCGNFHDDPELYRCEQCGAVLCEAQVWSLLGAEVGKQVFHNIYDPGYVVFEVSGREPDLKTKKEYGRKCGPCRRIWPDD